MIVLCLLRVQNNGTKRIWEGTSDIAFIPSKTGIISLLSWCLPGSYGIFCFILRVQFWLPTMCELWPQVSLWGIKPQFLRYISDVIPISLSTQSWVLSVFALWRFYFYFFNHIIIITFLIFSGISMCLEWECRVLALAKFPIWTRSLNRLSLDPNYQYQEKRN